MGLRCFIAISISEGVREAVSECIVGLRALGADVRWVRPENLHLTLKFLGDTTEEKLSDIRERLEEVSGSNRSFMVAFRGAGAFPDTVRPRVIWIGVEGPELGALALVMDRSLEGLGFEPEPRGFSPHLTIGRLRSPKGGLALVRGLEALADVSFGEMEAEGFSLYRSELLPGGARHTVLHDFRFPA